MELMATRHRSSLLAIILSLLAAVAIAEKAIPKCTIDNTTRLVPFLERVQETALATLGSQNFDPKFYTDLSLRFRLPVVMKAFYSLPRSSKGKISPSVLKEFISKYLRSASQDLVVSKLPDYVPEPEGFLPKVKHPGMRAWALEIHSLWNNLSMEVSSSVRDQPELHTLLPLPEPFIIPGSRFREVYYWDSYWVIRGLMASKMHETAKGLAKNLMYMIDKYGHVLNGGRIYYTNRSQPPLLSAMIREIYNTTNDINLVKEALPVLLKEHLFWTSGIHQIMVRDEQAESHNLSRYYAMWDEPRPESKTIDEKSASHITSMEKQRQFYRELATAAESGSDFSTRWMRNGKNLSTLAITSILPADLNAYILGMELDISYLAKVAGDKGVAEQFLKISEAREKAIRAIFWNETKGQWFDYWFDSDSSSEHGHVFEDGKQNQAPFASNFVPLWIKPFSSDIKLTEKVVRSLRSSGLLFPGGVVTSLTNSGQQWDFPNGWAPVQHMIVEGLLSSGSDDAKSLAEEIAVGWIRTNYVVYKKLGEMHEKYDVEREEYGGGGEYMPQTGFGWSNGVVLAFLEEFGWPEDREIG